MSLFITMMLSKMSWLSSSSLTSSSHLLILLWRSQISREERQKRDKFLSKDHPNRSPKGGWTLLMKLIIIFLEFLFVFVAHQVTKFLQNHYCFPSSLEFGTDFRIKSVWERKQYLFINCLKSGQFSKTKKQGKCRHEMTCNSNQIFCSNKKFFQTESQTIHSRLS